MTKCAVTVTIEVSTIEEARRKGINISEAAEAGILNRIGMKREPQRTYEDKIIAELAAKLPTELKNRFMRVYPNMPNNYSPWITLFFKATGNKVKPAQIDALYKHLEGKGIIA